MRAARKLSSVNCEDNNKNNSLRVTGIPKMNKNDAEREAHHKLLCADGTNVPRECTPKMRAHPRGTNSAVSIWACQSSAWIAYHPPDRYKGAGEEKERCDSEGDVSDAPENKFDPALWPLRHSGHVLRAIPFRMSCFLDTVPIYRVCAALRP